MSAFRISFVSTLAILVVIVLVSTAAKADDPIIIDGLFDETLLLPSLGEVIVLGPDGEINAGDGRGIEGNVATRITIDGGRVEAGSSNAIWTRAHSEIRIINNSEIVSGANTALSLSENATVLIRDSSVNGHINADDGLRVEIVNSQFGENIRGDSFGRVRLVNSSANDIRFNDDVEVEIINSTVVDRLSFDSNVLLFVDEQSTLYNRVIADHNLDFELRGTMELGQSGVAAINGASNFKVHLRGGSIIGNESGQRGFGIGQSGTIRLSEGASIETTSHAIEMTDSGTIILEPGSLVSSSGASSVRHLNALTLSADEATLVGSIDIGRSSVVSLNNSSLAGQERGLRVDRGSRVTLTGAMTSITAQNNRVIDLGDGSRLTMLAGALFAPVGSEFCRGIDINRGATAFIHGGSVQTQAVRCQAVEINRGQLVMTGGSLLAEGDDSPGVYAFSEALVRLSGSAEITTTGDRTETAANAGAHGLYGRNSVFEVDGGIIDIQGSGNFGLLGLDRSVFVVRGGQVMTDPGQNSFSLGVFEESEIRLLGLAAEFAIEIDGSGTGPQPVSLGVGDSVRLTDLHPDFADGSEVFSGIISGTWAHGEPFELSFTNQYDTADQDPLPPGDIILRGVPEPDPSTEVVITSQINPSEIHEAVVFTAEVSNPSTPPDDGQVMIMASSGESCSGENPVVSGNTVTWTCEIVFESVGTRAVSAEFSDSAQFEDSTSAPITQTVSPGLFIDRFEQPEPENG